MSGSRIGALALLSGALVLSVTACGGTTDSASAGGARLVPAGVPAFLAIDVDPASSQWQTIEQLAAKFPDERSAVARAKQELRKQGLDWDGDVKPALGSELDLVLLDLDNGGENAVALLRPSKAGRPFTARLPATAPGDAVLYYTFHGAGGIFSSLDKTAAFGARLGPLADLFGKLGSLLEGENAVYVRPPASGRLPEITLVTEPRPGVSGRATLDGIVARYRKQLGVLLRHGTVAGTPASTLGFGKVTLSWADVGGKLVISDLPAGIAAVQSRGTRLADNVTFRQALDSAGMPARTHGFLYVDVRAGTGLVEKLSGTKLPAAISRNLKPLRSAVEYAVSHQHQLSVRVFLQIQ